MKHRNRNLLRGTIAAVGLATTVALAPLSAAAKEDDTITWALPGLPDTLLVPHAWSVNTGGVMSLVQEGLTAFSSDLALTEGVADEWEQLDDTTYVYTIRDGVTFHDGSPVTARDVVYSMNWHLDPENGSQMAAFYAAVDSIEATADNEVTISLKHPDAQFAYTPAHMSGFIMKRDQLENNPDTYGTPDELPLGTGPYELVEFVPGERILLEANEDYWGTKPEFAQIEMLAIPDAQTRLLAMRNGDIDGTFGIPISEADQWSGLDGVNVVTTPSLGVYFLSFDFETPPLDNIHVRRAIAHSLDRKGLVNALLGGNGDVARAINPPEMWAGVMPADEVSDFYDTLNQYDFDLDMAAEEWKKAGVEGFSMSVPVSSSDPYMSSIMLTLAQNVKPLGIDLTVQELDHTQWLDALLSHENLGIQMRRYFPDYADPANYPFLFFASENAVVNGSNTSNYRDAEADQYLATALREADPETRSEALMNVTRKVNEDLPAVPIFWPDSAMAISADLQLEGFTAFWYNTPWAVRGFSRK
jgi:peptide/nickel transport system substrate-binding protein